MLIGNTEILKICEDNMEIMYFPYGMNLLKTNISDELYLNTLYNELSNIDYPIKKANRLIQHYGNNYSYSGINHKEQIVPEFVKDLMYFVNMLFNQNFNSILINKYPAGKMVGIGYHKDNEIELKTKTIVSLSLGSSDNFIFKKQ
jgi:hypothetical protein